MEKITGEMLPPDAPVTELKNVGPKRAALYQKLGIETVSDLLTFYPRSYQDFTSPKMAAECRDGEPAVIEGKILRKLPPAYIRKGMVLYKLTVTDGMQNFTVTIFNNEYAYYGVHLGETYIFAGKWNRLGNAGNLAMQNYLSPGEAATLRPVYPLTEGLSSKMVQTNVQDAIARALPGLPDPIPGSVRAEYGLIGFRQAVQEIHFPESQEQMETARDRLAFEELLRLTLALKFLKGRGREKTRVRVQRPDLKPFVKSLPFPLTGAQKRVIAEILRDMASPYPMNRLLQGDVGSGKTLVAAAPTPPSRRGTRRR